MAAQSSPLYLLRHPASTLSPALYSTQDRNISVCPLAQVSLSSPSSDQPMLAIQSRQGQDVVPGQTMTYDQLLKVIIDAPKVITI